MNQQDRCDMDHIEDQTPGELRESAYRRGFQQGFHEAATTLTQQVKGDFEAAVLIELARAIADWRIRVGRYKSKRDRVCLPPEIIDGKVFHHKPQRIRPRKEAAAAS